jgi:ATP-dependent RNA helicase SUPV3L1/SUV3
MSNPYSPESDNRGRGVTAVLGPTNTGKTHLAIERMLGHESGMIGLPLRLLAREVYDKVARQVGAGKVALITGEEKILPPSPRYYVCTVEAMPRDIDVAFLAVDEIQLAADAERGHVFTRHLLHARGRSETLLLGAATMKDAIIDLLPGANIISRPRLSELSYAGQKKISRLPRRTAIVSFTANDVYATAEQVRRQRGGAAVVLGALSPKTRNAQVELFENGEVDFLVATDAIGMGLNLNVEHVAFASIHKFDGQQRRELTNAEIGQIAGRAGRHTNDGTFGVTARVEPFDQARIAALEDHNFAPVKLLQWRSGELDFASLARLKDSLRAIPGHGRLARGGMVDDLIALENMSRDEKTAAMATATAAIKQLWEVCQIPDFRKISAIDHAELLVQLYGHLMSATGLISEDWFAEQVRFADNTQGDIDTLSNRIAHIRTWTFVSHRAEWLSDPRHWQDRTREIEDKLSDALHERLTQRFVDRRTSVLIKRLRDQDSLYVEIDGDGSVHVEQHFVGRLDGFRFTPDTNASGIHGKAARHAAAKVMVKELSERAKKLADAKPEDLALTRLGEITWEGAAVARLMRGETALKPALEILADEHLSALDKEHIEGKVSAWLKDTMEERLKPLIDLSMAEDISGLTRGIAFQLTENLGVLKRDDVADEIRDLDQEARGQLRRYGVRFGAYNIFMPALLKPAASDLILFLWALHYGPGHDIEATALPEPPREGLTSALADSKLTEAYYRQAGYHHCGKRVVRIDMLERLADMIRPLISWRQARPAQAPAQAQAQAQKNEAAKKQSVKDESKAPGANEEQQAQEESAPPEGATGKGSFRVTPGMMSIIGCSGDEFASVLKALGFRCERRAIAKAQPENGKPELEPAAKSETAHEALDKGKKTASTSDGNEQRFDEIWRPHRKSQHTGAHNKRGQRDNTAGRKQGRPHKGKVRDRKAKGGGSPPSRTGRPARRKTPEKPMDPDSPFAALKDLKRDLETRVKDGA